MFFFYKLYTFLLVAMIFYIMKGIEAFIFFRKLEGVVKNQFFSKVNLYLG